MRVETSFAAIALVLCTFASAHAESWTHLSHSGNGDQCGHSDLHLHRGRREAGRLWPASPLGGRQRRSDRAGGAVDRQVARQLPRPKNPPPGIIYKRITPRFFVVSSVKRGAIWYNRCNFYGHYVHCVLINYPAAEKRQWDSIVTRISNTLRGG